MSAVGGRKLGEWRFCPDRGCFCCFCYDKAIAESRELMVKLNNAWQSIIWAGTAALCPSCRWRQCPAGRRIGRSKGEQSLNSTSLDARRGERLSSAISAKGNHDRVEVTALGIEISNLSHTYPGTRRSEARQALKEISLQIRPGERLVFLGPNGSGKTTLMRILMTSLSPQSGTVRMGDLDLVRDVSQIRRQLGVVFQRPALDEAMTVAENLRAAARLYGISRADQRERIDGYLCGSGLEDRRKELVKNLSGGLSRRVELIKALLPKPRILILDEPTSGLDPVARRGFWEQIEAERRERELIVLVTTHLMDEAEQCDRVAILHQGELMTCGEPGRLRAEMGAEVLVVEGEDLEALAGEMEELFQVDCNIVDGALRMTLSQEISLDRLRLEFGNRIRSLSLSHPSLDAVFVDLTGQHLESPLSIGLRGSGD